MSGKKAEEKEKNGGLRGLFNNSPFTVVFSILLAVVCWLFVSMAVITETTETIRGIPVRLDYNIQTLQAMGLDVVLEGEAPTVNVRVTGPRSVVGGLTAEDILVYPRLNNVTEAGLYELDLTVVKQDANADFVIEMASLRPARVSVRFAKLQQKKFVVETDTSGIKPADGYILSKAYATPGEVTLTGPEEEIQAVGRVVARVEIAEELTSTRIATATLTVYDKEGNPMSDRLISVDAESVEVTVPILQKKTLPFTVGFTNLPDGFDLSLLQPVFSVESVNLAGPGDSIQNKTELSLGYIDLQREFRLGFTKTFPVMLDTGYENLDNLNQVTVSFDTSGFAEKSFTVSDIRVVNAPQNRQVTVDTQRIHEVTVIGPRAEVEALSAGSLVAEIDAGDLTLGEGEQTVPVTIRVTGSRNVFAVGSYTALVEIEAVTQ